jgi:hypothetical protein
VGLKINEEKTKYMKMSAVGDSRWSTNVTIGEYRFERVKHIRYLRPVLNSENLIKGEINKRITSGNRTCFAHVKLLKSTFLSRYSKVKACRSFIRPTVTYGSDMDH